MPSYLYPQVRFKHNQILWIHPFNKLISINTTHLLSPRLCPNFSLFEKFGLELKLYLTSEVFQIALLFHRARLVINRIDEPTHSRYPISYGFSSVPSPPKIDVEGIRYTEGRNSKVSHATLS